MSFAKMGLRFLNKRRLRTILTMIAIMLGVGILTGVNVTADSINSAVNAQIDAKLGSNDIIVRANKSIDDGWINYQSGKNIIESVPGIASVVPRIIMSHPSYPYKNSTSGLNVMTVAINASDPNEKYMGTCNITNALDPSFINTSRIEDLMVKYSYYFLPVVLSQNYANRYNVTPGDSFYIYSDDPSAFPGMVSDNTSTWLNATVIGVIQDTSKSVQNFMPPASISDLYPSSTAIYIDLAKAWSLVFKAHNLQVNMYFVHVKDPTQISSIQSDLKNLDSGGTFPGGIFTENVKSLFTQGILQVNSFMRGLFSIFSGISLLVCAIIIKNLLEMSKEEQMHQIGVMRAVGVTKRKILELFVTQILFISVVGSLLGLLFGYFISTFFVGSYVNAASAIGTNYTQYNIRPVITGMTALIGISAGVLVSLIFGFIPARSAANVDPLEALEARSEKEKRPLIIRTIQKTGNFSIAAGFFVGGIFAIISAFSGLFILDIIDPQVIILLFGGVILLIVGIVLLAAFFFPMIVPGLTAVFSPFLGKMRTITGRNLKKYSRQTKNTFAMLAIGLCMMVTVGTIMNSAYAGAYPGGRTITGGDLAIGNFYQGEIPMVPNTQGLRDLPLVQQAVPIRFSLGFNGLTRIDRPANNKTFGGVSDSVFGSVQESFHLGIIDPTEYSALQSHDSIVKLDNKSTTLSSLMNQLNQPYTVILQDRLSRMLGGIKAGEWVRMRFDGFEANFKVIGIFDILPGFYWSYYTTDNPFNKQFCGAISWSTYEKLIDDNIGNADVIAKNKFVPSGNVTNLLPSSDSSSDMMGYVSTPIDYQTLNAIADQTGFVQNTTLRQMSPFFGVPTFEWETNVSLYNPDVNLSQYYSSPIDPTLANKMGLMLNQTWALQNVLWHQNGSISPFWNPMMSRAYVVNPETDEGFGNTTIASVLPQIPAADNNSLDAIFKWAKTNMPHVNVCIANQIYVNYNLTSGKYNYIKEFVPGETIRMDINGSLNTDFLVIATTNSHYPYEYVDDQGKHHGDTYVLNYKALSFNTYKYNMTTQWDNYFEALDAEPNSIFIPNENGSIPSALLSQDIPNLINQYLNNGTINTGSGSGSGSSSNSTSNLQQYDAWWINNLLQNKYLLNNSAYAGSLNTSLWNATYNYNGSTYSINGTTFTYQGNSTPMNFTVNIPNGTEVLKELALGNMTLTLNNLTSEVMWHLNDNMSLEDIQNFINSMQAICKTIPSLENVTFFSPKLFMLQDSGLFNVYFLIGVKNENDINTALMEIENYYISHGYDWNMAWVKEATSVQQEVGGVLSLITNMFFGVLAFALIASLLGLAISTIISVKKRYAEIGTLKTLGFSNRQILQMIIGEGVITAIFGIIVGLFAGLLIAGLIISNLPFMIFLPMVFTPPIQLIILGFGILVLASIAVSFIPAISATRIDIADAIRTKGE